MRLFKKISYDRFIELPESSSFVELFNKKAIDKKSIDKFNFYLVIEYQNAFDSANYDEMFPDNSLFVDFQSLKKEHSNIINKIKKQMENKTIPDSLKKIGVTNILKGCYLVGNINNDLPKNIRSCSKKNISIKLEYKNVPKEIVDLCEDFYHKNIFSILKEKEDFENFFKLTKKEQEKEISILFQQFLNYTNKNIIFSTSNVDLMNQDNNFNNNSLTVEELFEKNIDFISDIKLLEQVFQNAEKDENYELCGIIKKRLDFIKSSKKV